MNKKTPLLFVTLFAVACITACGKGEDSEFDDLPELTSEQKSTLKSTLNNTGHAMKSGKKQGRTKSIFAAETAGNANPPGGPALSELDALEEKNHADMDQLVEDGVTNGSCKTKQTQSSFQLNGTSCPVVLESSQTKSKDSFELKVDFKIQDKEAKKLNDIDQFNFSVSGSVEATEKSGSVDLKYSGDIHSQKSGDLKISGKFKIKGDEKSSSGEATFNLKFPDFKAQIKVAGKNEGEKEEVKYYINKKEVTEKEMQQFVEGLKTFNTVLQ